MTSVRTAMNFDPSKLPDRDMTARMAPRLYGRRKGKKLRSRQAELLQSLLPKVRIDLSQNVEDVSALFAPFVPSNLWLEIGFGGGEHLISEALRHPEIGFLGCEPFINGIAKALSAIAENGISNIRIHPDDARELIARLPTGSIARVDLLFPDPWPKRRQRKRRFVSDTMFSALARIMQDGAELRFATDVDDYAAWTLRLSESSDFTWAAETAQDWLIPWGGWIGTRYEARAVREGRRPVYLTFVRRRRGSSLGNQSRA